MTTTVSTAYLIDDLTKQRVVRLSIEENMATGELQVASAELTTEFKKGIAREFIDASKAETNGSVSSLTDRFAARIDKPLGFEYADEVANSGKLEKFLVTARENPSLKAHHEEAARVQARFFAYHGQNGGKAAAEQLSNYVLEVGRARETTTSVGSLIQLGYLKTEACLSALTDELAHQRSVDAIDAARTARS